MASSPEDHGFCILPREIENAEGLYAAWREDMELDAEAALKAVLAGEADAAKRLQGAMAVFANPPVPYATFDLKKSAAAYCTVCNRHQNGGSAIAVLVHGPVAEDAPLIEVGDFRWAVMDVAEAIEAGFPYTYLA